MSKAVIKLIDYLNDSIKIVQKNLSIRLLVENRMPNDSDNEYFNAIITRKNFIRFLNLPKEDWDKIGEIFVNFKELSELLFNAKLKRKEKLEIIMFIIERNISTGMLSNYGSTNYYLNTNLLNNYHFKNVSLNEILAFLNSKKYYELTMKREDELSILEKDILESIDNAFKVGATNLEPIVVNHQILKKHLLDKKPDINLDDVKLIILALKNLGLTQILLDEIQDYLVNLVNKKKNNYDISIKPVYEYKTNLSNKELKILNKELSFYYDLDNDIAFRFLTLDEQIKALYLMQKLGFTKDRINNILVKINKLNLTHPISLYKELYKRFCYYKNNEEVSNLLKELEEYFKNIFICDIDEYEIIKLCFEEDMQKLLKIIPNTFEFEYEQAKHLIK